MGKNIHRAIEATKSNKLNLMASLRPQPHSHQFKSTDFRPATKTTTAPRQSVCYSIILIGFT